MYVSALQRPLQRHHDPLPRAPEALPVSGAGRLKRFEARSSSPQALFGALREEGPRGGGYLRHLGEPRGALGNTRGALGNTREYWGVLSYLSPLDPPPLRIP